MTKGPLMFKPTFLVLLAFTLLSSYWCHAQTQPWAATTTDPEIAASKKGWADKPLLFSLFALMNIREKLLSKNLFATENYQEYGAINCPPETRYVRTADGTCNNLQDPAMGAVHTTFGRNIHPNNSRPQTHLLMVPNPREISLKLLTRKKFKPLHNMNVLGIAWLQFMVHDWINHENESYALDSVFEIPLAVNDPLGKGVLYVPKTKQAKALNGAPVYRNTVTHWWDGSQLYGSDKETLQNLRAFYRGQLKVTREGRLPLGSDGIEMTGMTNNWWAGLSLIHNLFVLEHNRIANELHRTYPHWDDQKLFDVARLVNTALMAKIQLVDWTPQMHPNKAVGLGMDISWNGILHMGSFGKGIVGGETKMRKTPFSLTEEFVSAYRFHPLLPESLQVVSAQKGGPVLETVALSQMRNEKSHALTDRYSMNDLLYSFGQAPAGEQSLFNYPQFMQNLEMPVIGKMDLAAVEILRDRERGVPRYNEFRRQLQMEPIQKFEDLTSDPEKLRLLKEVYRNDVELLDLMVGALAEENIRPKGLGFSGTFFQIFIMMTPRRLEADRFFTTDYRAEVYSERGLRWVKENNFKTVLLRHYPQLADKLKNVKNAFAPWN